MRIIEAEKDGTLYKTKANNIDCSAQSEHELPAPLAKIGDPKWGWQFVRHWSSSDYETVNGFIVTKDGGVLEIRNDFYETASAKTTLTLDPNSKYEFAVEIRMIGYERYPQDAIDYPQQRTGGAFPLYDSYSEKYGKVIKMGPPKVSTNEWTKRTWVVYTADAQNYELELINGGTGGNCKGIACFRKLAYKKLDTKE
jgi:hypothetical protein